MKQSNTTTTYICPMCPQVRQDKPGICPECGMPLVEEEQGKGKSPEVEIR